MYFTVFFYQLSWVGYVLLCLSGLYLAVGFCGEAEFRLGQRDPGQIILDEFTAMPLCFLGWTALAHHYPPWAIFLAGFALFRLFDISKPFGIRKIQDLPAGWGVVADDVMAALATCLSMHLIAWVMRAF
jgi:phosphatidylglycerophosphatase A